LLSIPSFVLSNHFAGTYFCHIDLRPEKPGRPLLTIKQTKPGKSVTTPFAKSIERNLVKYEYILPKSISNQPIYFFKEIGQQILELHENAETANKVQYIFIKLQT
jgi:hypothetical protein